MIDVERLQRLIEGGESFTVEFKSEARAPLSDHDLVEAVVCLANGNGGYLLIGVEDDGTVSGARARHGVHTNPIRLQAMIFNHTVPSHSSRAEVVSVNGIRVLVIEVPRAERPVCTSRGRYIRRVTRVDGKPGCEPFYYHQMISRQADLGLMDYSDSVVEGATWEDLDPLEFERLRQCIRKYQGDQSLLALNDVELAKALGLVRSDTNQGQPTVAGLLIVGREAALARYLPCHEMAFQVLRGRKVLVNDFFRSPLVKLSEMLYERFRARHQEQEILVGMFRLGIPDYAPAAFREAVHNALIHRDYARLGGVYVQWYEDRIEFSNPGGFVEGVRLDNLLVVQPKPRNPRLADIFKRIGLVERTGRGIDIIFEGQLRCGHPVPDYSRSTESSVSVTLLSKPANLHFARFIAEWERDTQPLPLEALLILNEAQDQRQINIALTRQITQRSEIECRATLERLVELGLLRGKGKGRSRVYFLADSVRDALGVVETSRESREPVQQEAIVKQFVRKQERITRAQVMQLCKISAPQAYRLLKRLADRGILRKVGSGRGAHYESMEAENR